MNERYDIAVIGSGPAGLSAAINSRIRNKNIIVFGSRDLSYKLAKAPKINNYLGYFDISGPELKNKFQEHIKHLGINITYERVNAVYAMGDYFALSVNDKMYEAKTVILATGVEQKKPLKGEEEFLGKGVGYCATCDAPLYRGKNIAIIAYNKDAEEEANYVSELAGKLYYIPMYNGEYKLNANIEIIKEKPLEISGNLFVSKLVLSNRTVDTDAVFVFKDSVPPGQLVPGLEMEDNHIKVSRNLETNLPGCYAAGDCTGRPYQYLKSAGEGQAAALNAVSFIDKTK